MARRDAVRTIETQLPERAPDVSRMVRATDVNP
jgi:hypothetical protein